MSKTFGLKFQSRVLRSYPPATELSAWIVATNNLREENEIRILQYDGKSEMLMSPAVYVHQNEVWDLDIAAHSQEMLLTLHSTGSQSDVTLWKMQQEDEKLECLCALTGFEERPKKILWRGANDGSKTVLCLEGTSLKEWDLSQSVPKEVSSGNGQDLDHFFTMHMPKTDLNLLYITNHQGYQLWDLRQMQSVQSYEDCHEMPLKCLDSSEHFIVTGGDDCLVKIWDNRNPEKPILVLSGHAHWVWDCKFNPKLPNLLLSSSSDCSVLLWDINKPKDESPHGTSPNSVMYDMRGDENATRFTDHDESVYCVDWSLVDEWSFASLSYDGRIVLNKVPSDVKYRILI